MPAAELIENWFSYHPPTGDQLSDYKRLRDAAKEFAHIINDVCPESADKTYAIRLVRLAVMTANASIACEGK